MTEGSKTSRAQLVGGSRRSEETFNCLWGIVRSTLNLGGDVKRANSMKRDALWEEVWMLLRYGSALRGRNREI
jgi:hypothetical protein